MNETASTTEAHTTTNQAKPPAPVEGELQSNTAPIVPGQRTTEAAAASVVGVAALIPIIQSVFSKQGDTTVEVICLSVVACVYIVSRTWLKARP